MNLGFSTGPLDDKVASQSGQEDHPGICLGLVHHSGDLLHLHPQLNKGPVRNVHDMPLLFQTLLDFRHMAHLRIFAIIQQQGDPIRRPDKILRQADPGSA